MQYDFPGNMKDVDVAIYYVVFRQRFIWTEAALSPEEVTVTLNVKFQVAGSHVHNGSF